MDDEGYIPLAVIASFNRVRMLTPDPLIIMEALADSETVEVSKDREYLRTRVNFAHWVLPVEQRDPMAHKPKPAPPAPAEHVKPPRRKPAVHSSNLEEDELGELQEEDMFQLDEEHEAEGGEEEGEEEEEEVMDDRTLSKLIIVTQSRRRGGGGRVGEDAEHVIKDGLQHYEKEIFSDGSRREEGGRPPRPNRVRPPLPPPPPPLLA